MRLILGGGRRQHVALAGHGRIRRHVLVGMGALPRGACQDDARKEGEPHEDAKGKERLEEVAGGDAGDGAPVAACADNVAAESAADGADAEGLRDGEKRLANEGHERWQAAAAEENRLHKG